jgi:hypothetical protein
MTSENQLKRVKYHHGMLLSAKDLTAEQEYFLERQRRHNRYLHGWGVVSGLLVSIDNGEVLVEPGMVIDCAGNEIFLERREKCDLPEGVRKVYVVVEYCESEVDPLPVLNTDDPDQVPQAHSRILEGGRVYVMETDPVFDHDGMGPGSPGCNRKHPIPIACVAIKPKESKVIPCGRR